MLQAGVSKKQKDAEKKRRKKTRIGERKLWHFCHRVLKVGLVLLSSLILQDGLARLRGTASEITRQFGLARIYLDFS